MREENGRFTFDLGTGTERKTTGSYYTRPELVQELIKSALEPVIADRLRVAKPDQREDALLGLKVCDPACGSGHFLLAAARRIGTELAKVRTGEEAPAPDAVREAIRDVITHCIYGVDRNPLAVDLCKVALWIEGHSGGKPLTFLDHRIRCGDSLVGVSDLSVLEDGIPDEAFTAVTGDDRKLASAIRKQNKQEREKGVFALSFDTAAEVHDLVEERRELESLHDDTPDQIHRKREAWERLQRDGGTLWRERMACHLWTAAFFAELTPDAQQDRGIPTTADLRRFMDNPDAVDARLRGHVWAVGERNRFFHWPLEFPEVYEGGGFSCIVGNPPWLSYSGRQTVSSPRGFLALLGFQTPSVSAWPASHTAFWLRSLTMCVEGGKVGFVMPRQVADLERYQPVRTASDAISSDVAEVVDVGEGVFPGVTQAVGIFVAKRASARRLAPPTKWSMSRAPWLTSSSVGDSDATNLLSDDARLILASLPVYPSGTFSDPGVHTGNVSKRIILDHIPDDDPRVRPVREGKDINLYFCGPPRKGLLWSPTLEAGQYCRIGQLDRYTSTPIIIRQTADRPIAARHTDRTYYRNSLLACAGVPGLPDEVLLGVLNSCLVCLVYRSAVQESGQKAFPQVKVGNLQRLPLFPVTRVHDAADGAGLASTIGEHLTILVRKMEERLQTGASLAAEVDLGIEIERLVLRLYGLPAELAASLWRDVYGTA